MTGIGDEKKNGRKQPNPEPAEEPLQDEMRRRSSAGSVMTINPSVRPPPKFVPDAYSRWKEGIGFWREIHSFAAEGALIAEMALSGEDVLRNLLVGFLRETKTDKTARNFIKLFEIMDKEFGRDSAEKAMNRLALFNSWQRYANESIRAFWIRVQKIWYDAKSSGVDIAPKMKFIRGLQALNLTEARRVSVLAAISQPPDHRCPILLQDLTVELFAPMFHMAKPEEVFWQDAADDGVAIDGEDLLPTYLTQSKTRNRPGLDKAAVRYSAQNMGMPNGIQTYGPQGGMSMNRGKGGQKGKMQCFRRDSTAQIARECHLPFQKVPTFSTASRPKGKNGKAIHFTDSVSMGEEKDTGKGGESLADGLLNSDSTPNAADNPQAADPIHVTDDNWYGQWWGSEIMLVSAAGPPAQNIRAKESYRPDVSASRVPSRFAKFFGIVDSGASWSIVGSSWLSRWYTKKDGDWRLKTPSSTRRFRFGDHRAMPSLGSVIISSSTTDVESNRIPITIEVDVVEGDLPLPIPRRSLAKMSTCLDFFLTHW